MRELQYFEILKKYPKKSSWKVAITIVNTNKKYKDTTRATCDPHTASCAMVTEIF